MKGAILSGAMLAFTLLCASGCGNNDASQSNQPVEIKTVPELSPFRGADSLDQTITWREGPLDKNWADLTGAEQAAKATITLSSSRLAAIDYASLSLPDFVTQTRVLNLKPSDFTGQDLYVDAYGEDSNNKKWVLYAWRGPELPAHPDRPLVHRWVYVYALCDVESKQVTRLLATIHGEVQE